MKYTYLDYLYLEIGLEEEDVKAIAQSGSNDEAAEEVSKKQYVIDQLKGSLTRKLIDAVKSLCDDPNVDDRETAIEYIVWIVAWNIAEEEE